MPFQITPTHFDAVRGWFDENFDQRGERGAALSIWQDGQEVLSLAAGFVSRDTSHPWTPQTLVPVWSSTKGVAALTSLIALNEAGVSVDARVSEIWPEFGQANKGDVRFRHLLSHTAGLSALDVAVPILEYANVIRSLENQIPLHPPGERQAYHARTFGFLLDEVVRRVTGASSLADYYDQMLRAPLNADFWLGLPPEHHDRVATLYPGRMTTPIHDDAFLTAFQTPGSLTLRSFQSPKGLNAVTDFNRSETWSLGLASMGGVGSAQGLGRLYALLAAPDSFPGLSSLIAPILPLLIHPVSSGFDAVLHQPMAFSHGMMKDPVDPITELKLRRLFGPSFQAFGHPGAGGSLCFADPENRIAFAYVMNQMEVGVLPSAKALGLVDRLYGLPS